MDINDYFLMFICIIKNIFLLNFKKEIKDGKWFNIYCFSKDICI